MTRNRVLEKPEKKRKDVGLYLTLGLSSILLINSVMGVIKNNLPSITSLLSPSTTYAHIIDQPIGGGKFGYKGLTDFSRSKPSQEQKEESSMEIKEDLEHKINLDYTNNRLDELESPGVKAFIDDQLDLDNPYLGDRTALEQAYARIAGLESYIKEAASNSEYLTEHQIKGIILKETGASQLHSNQGAHGLMQVKPEIFLDYDPDLSKIYNPKDNILAGSKSLDHLMEFFNGNLRMVLAANNWGLGKIKKYGLPYINNPTWSDVKKANWDDIKEHAPTETKEYIDKVLGYIELSENWDKYALRRLDAVAPEEFSIQVHIVKQGENLTQIARKYFGDNTAARVLEFNPEYKPKRNGQDKILSIGDRLILPKPKDAA